MDIKCLVTKLLYTVFAPNISDATVDTVYLLSTKMLECCDALPSVDCSGLHTYVLYIQYQVKFKEKPCISLDIGQNHPSSAPLSSAPLPLPLVLPTPPPNPSAANPCYPSPPPMATMYSTRVTAGGLPISTCDHEQVSY
jgi:hypothetical protein